MEYRRMRWIYYTFFSYFTQFKDFINQHKDTVGSLRATKKSLEYIEGCINWMKNHGKKVEDWLQSQVDSLSSRLEDLWEKWKIYDSTP